jgi:hypothetical protein
MKNIFTFIDIFFIICLILVVFGVYLQHDNIKIPLEEQFCYEEFGTNWSMVMHSNKYVDINPKSFYDGKGFDIEIRKKVADNKGNIIIFCEEE